ncbi:MAG: hypothetical protein P4L88_06955 [Rhodoferax sp.]|nr:hypothetical protein [Rhodoferax sp.]
MAHHKPAHAPRGGTIRSGTFSDAKHKAPGNRLFADGNSKGSKEICDYQIMLIFVK